MYLRYSVTGYLDEKGALCLEGKNSNGILGINSEEYDLKIENPVRVLDRVKQFSNDAHSVCAATLCENGDVFAWGSHSISIRDVCVGISHDFNGIRALRNK